MYLYGFREYFRKSRKNVLKVGKSRNFWSKVGHCPKSRKNDSKVGKSEKSRTPLTVWVLSEVFVNDQCTVNILGQSKLIEVYQS